jgi:hypothetical protein
MELRLIIHTASIAKSDVNTFSAAANQLKKDYFKTYPKSRIVLKFVKSGREIVNCINAQPLKSLISLDIVSHGNQGGIHIARLLPKPVESGFIQAHAHVKIRSNTDKPQTSEDAKYIEESMHGLYTDWLAKKGVSYYYNQTFNSSTDVAYLSDIKFDRFKEEAFIEFHGCRTAENIPFLNTYMHDNFAKQFSDMLPKNCTVVGHITNSNPNKKPKGGSSDYRHGRVNVYKNSTRVQKEVERLSLKFANSSTPSVKK